MEIKFRGIVSKSRDPHGQFYGRRKGSKVNMFYYFLIRKIMTALDSLSNYLSNHTTFMEIGLMVPEICRLKVGDHALLCKMKIFGVL